jgi:hypothetical protein
VVALLKPPVVVVKTGMPVAVPLFVQVMVLTVAAALAPPTTAQELAVMPLTLNEMAEGIVPDALAEPDGGVAIVVSTPLRV